MSSNEARKYQDVRLRRNKSFYLLEGIIEMGLIIHIRIIKNLQTKVRDFFLLMCINKNC